MMACKISLLPSNAIRSTRVLPVQGIGFALRDQTARFRMDLLSALKAFCRVVEAGGISAAAAGINVSPAVMSPKVRAFVDFASEVYRSPQWA